MKVAAEEKMGPVASSMLGQQLGSKTHVCVWGGGTANTKVHRTPVRICTITSCHAV